MDLCEQGRWGGRPPGGPPAWVPRQAGLQVENVVGADWWTGVGSAGVAWGLGAARETEAGLLPGGQPAAGFLCAPVPAVGSRCVWAVSAQSHLGSHGPPGRGPEDPSLACQGPAGLKSGCCSPHGPCGPAPPSALGWAMGGWATKGILCPGRMTSLCGWRAARSHKGLLPSVLPADPLLEPIRSCPGSAFLAVGV